MRKIAPFFLVLSVSCSSAQASQEPPLRQLNFCKLPGNACEPISTLPDEIQAELVELWWCCPYAGKGNCALVADPLWCDPNAEYAIYCEWGRTVEQTTAAGPGLECFW